MSSTELFKEKIAELHGKKASIAFMDQFAEPFTLKHFDLENGMKLWFVEKPNAKPFTWNRVRE